MGLITSDITALGIVAVTDSKPAVITEGAVTPESKAGSGPRMICRRSAEFTGFLTFVGTEQVGDKGMGDFLKDHSQQHFDLPLEDYRDQLTADLSAAWEEHDLTTGLWVFITGCEKGQPVFHYVNNIGGMSGVIYTGLTKTFQGVDDLRDNLLPTFSRAGESKESVLGRMVMFVRNGALNAVVEPLDDFTALTNKLYDGRYPEFQRFSSVTAYAALVRMRSEFVKRLFKADKGLWPRGALPPVGGTIYVGAVDIDGNPWRIPVKDLDQPKPYDGP